MDLELSSDQEELRDGLRRMLCDRVDHDARRAAMGMPGAIDRPLWEELADIGVFSLRLAESDGGLGAGMAEAVIVHEEIGRAAVPGPVAVTSLLAPYLPGAANGTVVATALYPAAAPLLVEHLDGADTVAVLTPDSIGVLSPSDLDALPVAAPLDPLTPVHRCNAPPAERTDLAGADAARSLWTEGTVLTAATAVGLAAAAVEMGSAYAKERTQFGRSIGAFQAVKHLLADALAATEVARAAVIAGGLAIDEHAPPGTAERAVAAARILAARAAQTATRTCVQVHGGMGYTWELDAHLLLKRALVLDTHFCTARSARRRLLSAF